jgi:uncharacterized protein with HEPN domain
MLDASREAVASASGRSRDDLDRERIWALGLVKCVEIVGEAAAKIGKEVQARHPQVPWPQIVAMRNRLVHAYFDIDLDQVWKAVTEDMPALVGQLEKAVAAEER